MADRAPTAEELARAPALPLVLYDGACRLCTAQAERVRRIAGDRLRAAPLQEALPGVPWVDPDEAARALTLVDEGGRVVRGAGAVLEVAIRGWPLLRLLRPVYAVPLVRWLAERAYAAVAARRSTLFGRIPAHDPCDDGACGVPWGERERAVRR